jgi:hypothetical protein
VGEAGDTPRTGETGIAITDHQSAVVAPAPVAPVHETDMLLWPQGLNALQQVATQAGADLRGTSRNLDGGGDAARPRPGRFPAGLIPTITERPRTRKTTTRGHMRRSDAAICAWRMRVERTLAWEDTGQRWWLRVERLQRRHAGMKWLA